MKVIVVDDEPVVLRMIKLFLEAKGLAVLAAACGEEGWDLIGKHGSSIGALVTDYMMPGISGWELARRTRQSGHTFPIIIISGYLHEAMQTEDFECMGKPLDFKKLASTLLNKDTGNINNANSNHTHALATSQSGSFRIFG